MNKVIFFCLFLVASLSFAQQKKSLKLNKETNLIEATYYHDNGEISQTGTFTAEGKLEGNWIRYNEQGEKLVSAFYKNGNKVGKWIHWINGEKKIVTYTENVASL